MSLNHAVKKVDDMNLTDEVSKGHVENVKKILENLTFQEKNIPKDELTNIKNILKHKMNKNDVFVTMNTQNAPYKDYEEISKLLTNFERVKAVQISKLLHAGPATDVMSFLGGKSSNKRRSKRNLSKKSKRSMKRRTYRRRKSKKNV